MSVHICAVLSKPGTVEFCGGLSIGGGAKVKPEMATWTSRRRAYPSSEIVPLDFKLGFAKNSQKERMNRDLCGDLVHASILSLSALCLVCLYPRLRAVPVCIVSPSPPLPVSIPSASAF